MVKPNLQTKTKWILDVVILVGFLIAMDTRSSGLAVAVVRADDAVALPREITFHEGDQPFFIVHNQDGFCHARLLFEYTKLYDDAVKNMFWNCG